MSLKKTTAPSKSSKATISRYYSVQVATCRTNKCVNAFSKRLRAKGYTPIVSGRANSSALTSLTEVIIGEFGDNDSAKSLATSAKKKKISASVYQKNDKWLVSVGAYPDLEDAAERLDQVEDSGFRGRLSLKKSIARSTKLRAVRAGKLKNRREALALRARISRSGFPGSYVVRR
ncbi:MAG: SPOR domain-containing protein [Nitrospinaceae bacterium]|nr:SPOR domain-containing protein [Nitrospinaceae bacterium]